MVSNNGMVQIFDFFLTVILSPLESIGNDVQASFLVRQVLHTSATVLQYRQVFTQLSLHV